MISGALKDLRKFASKAFAYHSYAEYLAMSSAKFERNTAGRKLLETTEEHTRDRREKIKATGGFNETVELIVKAIETDNIESKDKSDDYLRQATDSLKVLAENVNDVDGPNFVTQTAINAAMEQVRKNPKEEVFKLG